MKKLLTNEKQLLVGGGGFSKVKPKTYKTTKKKEASGLTKLNNYFHGSGLVAISSIAALGHFTSSVQELLNKTQGNEIEKKYHTYKTALRPSFRFSNSYWNSSVTFGMPWYY